MSADSELYNCFLTIVLKFYLFWAYFGPRLQNALFKMKLSTKGYAGGQFLNSTTVFLNSVLKIPFQQANFVPKLQTARLSNWADFSSNVILNYVHKVPF